MRINDNCENKFQESDCFELKQAAKKKKRKTAQRRDNKRNPRRRQVEKRRASRVKGARKKRWQRGHASSFFYTSFSSSFFSPEAVLRFLAKRPGSFRSRCKQAVPPRGSSRHRRRRQLP